MKQRRHGVIVSYFHRSEVETSIVSHNNNALCVMLIQPVAE